MIPRKSVPGEPFDQSARSQGDFADAVEALRGEQMKGAREDIHTHTFIEGTKVAVENISGMNVPWYGVLELGNPKQWSGGILSEGEADAFQQQVYVKGVAPGDDWREHVYGIAQEPINKDCVGDMLVVGITQAKVYIKSQAALQFECAKPIEDDVEKLEATTEGPFKILWSERKFEITAKMVEEDEDLSEEDIHSGVNWALIQLTDKSEPELFHIDIQGEYDEDTREWWFRGHRVTLCECYVDEDGHYRGLAGKQAADLVDRISDDRGWIRYHTMTNGLLLIGEIVSISWEDDSEDGIGLREEVEVISVSGLRVLVEGGSGDDFPEERSDVTITIQTEDTPVQRYLPQTSYAHPGFQSRLWVPNAGRLDTATYPAYWEGERFCIPFSWHQNVWVITRGGRKEIISQPSRTLAFFVKANANFVSGTMVFPALQNWSTGAWEIDFDPDHEVEVFRDLASTVAVYAEGGVGVPGHEDYILGAFGRAHHVPGVNRSPGLHHRSPDEGKWILDYVDSPSPRVLFTLTQALTYGNWAEATPLSPRGRKLSIYEPLRIHKGDIGDKGIALFDTIDSDPDSEGDPEAEPPVLPTLGKLWYTVIDIEDDNHLPFEDCPQWP